MKSRCLDSFSSTHEDGEGFLFESIPISYWLLVLSSLTILGAHKGLLRLYCTITCTYMQLDAPPIP